MLNIGQLLSKGYEILKDEGIESYQLDCQLLLCKVLKKNKLFIIINRDLEVPQDIAIEYLKLVEFRKNGMPVKYILGESEFMGINFKVRSGVLIPRPDTEVLVESVISDMKKYYYSSICDVCCGSGAIGLSIAKYVEKVQVCCCDIEDIAIEVTKENVDRLKLNENVKVIKSDLLDFAINKKEKFDVIVSNPPYIKKGVIPMLMKDVKNYEPYIALCGGEDGLDFYREITLQSLKVLNKKGLLAFEIGYDQREVVKNMLLCNGFKNVECIKDLSGNDRVIKGIIDL